MTHDEKTAAEIAEEARRYIANPDGWTITAIGAEIARTIPLAVRAAEVGLEMRLRTEDREFPYSLHCTDGRSDYFNEYETLDQLDADLTNYAAEVRR